MMNAIFLGNDAGAWTLALTLGLLSLLVLHLVKRLLASQLRRLAGHTATDIDDIAVTMLDSTAPAFLWALSAFVASQALTLSPKAEQVLAHGMVALVLLQALMWGDTGIREWLNTQRNLRHGADPAKTTSTAALGFVARAVLWTVGILTILDNFGVDITALVASLGIGGIAVALALQNVLGDLFSSLSIVLDKPFVVGDFILVDGQAGTVEYVGLKTTRLRGLGGEQIVFSNSDLLKSRIHNYKRMETRRIAFTIGVTYQTPEDRLAELPAVIRELVASQPDVTFDRAHFKSFGASSLDFEVVYFLASADYTVYMDVQQAINLALFRRFNQLGVEFAYPTQSLHHVMPPGWQAAGQPLAEAPA